MTIKFNITKKHIAIAAVVTLVALGLTVYLQRQARRATTDSPIDFKEQQTEIQSLREYAAKNGVVAAYEKVKVEHAANQAAGHDFAHVIGRIAYEQMGTDGFSVCDSNFGFGCYHGLMEELIREKGPSGYDIARSSCNKLAGVGQIASCLHGLGHGVMGSVGNITKAIEQCKTFADNERAYCYDGSYMEYYTGVMEDYTKGQQVIDKNDPWKFCLGQYAEAQTQCVRNVTLTMAYRPEYGSDLAIAKCGELSDALRTSCVGTIGLYAVQANGIELEVIRGVCQKFPEKAQYASCMESSARELVFQGNIPKAEQLCTTDSAIRKTCEAAVAQMKIDYKL